MLCAAAGCERFYGQSLREFCEMISKRSFDRFTTIATTDPVRFPYSRLFCDQQHQKSEKGENTILGQTMVYIII